MFGNLFDTRKYTGITLGSQIGAAVRRRFSSPHRDLASKQVRRQLDADCDLHHGVRVGLFIAVGAFGQSATRVSRRRPSPLRFLRVRVRQTAVQRPRYNQACRLGEQSLTSCTAIDARP